MERLLVIAPHFPPSTVVGMQRALRLVRRIPQFGWEPYVLTRPPQCQAWPRVDGGDDELARVRVWTVPCRSMWWHETYWPQLPVRWRNLPRLAARAFARFTYPLLPIDVDYPWALAATGVGVAVVRRYRIDLIWSTAPPLSALCLARRIGRRTGVPYIADFRDVPLGPQRGSSSRRTRGNVRVEGAVLRDAAGFTYASPRQLEVLTQRHAFVADRPQSLVYNGFEPDEISNCPIRAFDQPTILHGGNLYGGTRRVDGLLAALAILQRRDNSVRAGVQFRHFGLDRDATLLARCADRHGVAQAVHTEQTLPRRQFLSACRGADILLVIVGHDTRVVQHAGAIPAKLYDYFAACRPVLVVGPRDCEAARMVKRLNRGLGVPVDAPEQIARAIERLLAGRGASGALDLALEAVAEFESSVIVGKMAEFFSSLVP